MERSNLNMTEDTEESEWIDVQPRKKKKRGLCHFHKREEAAATLAAVSAASATPPAGPPAPATPPADTPAPVTPAAAAQPKALPRAPTAATRFKVNGPSPVDFINRLNDPRLSFIAKPNRYGDFILYSKNENTSRLLSQHDHLEPLREATRKAVILHYPLQLPLDLVQSLPDVLTVYRCTNKAKEPLRKLIATFRGTIPEKIDLKNWGTFPTANYTPEPLRCFKCQRFGHHQARCASENHICGVCSQRHPTEECISKLKAKEVTTPKCPNCNKKHHAWSRFCPARLKLISSAKTSQSTPPPPRQPVPRLQSAEEFPALPPPPCPVQPTVDTAVQTPPEKPAPVEGTRIIKEIKTFLGNDGLNLLIETIAKSILYWISSKDHLQLDERVKGGTMEGFRDYLSVLEARPPDGT